jgi:PIN domain nuclease of toxin-antitoxin system
VSSAVAFEFTDLQTRRHFPVHEPIDFLAEGWRIAQSLPDIHRDPVDRMLIAHTILGGSILVTADVNIRRYPVETLW